ncbi:flagellin lysine-N-methylase [Clostridium tyrobutyricum]|uniref:flagellin lysine-N-methylase n=1 Tax=Clostridium tyrobutyricum TaxID=1519 RepID=UPI0039F713C7
MKNFQCIGAKCEDNCCYGWKVSIDNETYKKYRKTNESSLKFLLNSNVTRNRSNPSPQNYAKIRMKKDGDCPFLEEDKLCKIHEKLGPQFLSKVCRIYPRLTNIVNGIYEKSATLSCPEIARLILLNSNAMEFDEIEESVNIDNNIVSQLYTDNIKYANKVKKYFWKLRIFSISLLQNRKYSITNRLIILGLFIKNIQECVNSEKIKLIPSIIQKYNNIIENGDLEEYLNSIPANLNIQVELMKEFNDQRFLTRFSKNAQSYINCVIEFLKGMEYTDKSNIEDIVKLYRESYLDIYEPFMKDHEYILENLLVNHVFSKLFSINSKEGVFDDYMKLVIYYSLIKMLLIGMAVYNKKLDENVIIRLVYSFSRAIEHNNVFFNNTFKLFKQNGYNTMAYMAILIKN